MAKIHYIIAIFLIFLFSSCKSEQSKILSQADSVMESRPDSAMTLLESIDRSRLTQSELPYYALLYTQAQVKTDVPLDSDSLISIAFARYGDAPKDDRGLRANFYTGEVLFNRQKNPQAMRYFLTVYEESKRLGNNYWRAKAAERISDLFFFAYKYDEAEKYAQEAAQLFKSVGRQTFHRYTLAALANIYINNGYNEKAYHLLDSLKKTVINTHPVDSSLLQYMNNPMMSAMLNTGRANEIDFDNIEPDNDKTDGELVDDAVFQSQLLDSIGEADKATGILSDVQLLAHTDEDKVHLLYAQYENAKSVGDKSLALSLVDSLLFYQNKVADDIILESVVGAQRDFYSEREILHRHKSYILKSLLIAACLVFIMVVIFIILLAHYRNKTRKAELKVNLESLNSLRSYSDSLLYEKKMLEDFVKEKENVIRELAEKISEGKHSIESLGSQIKEKDRVYGQIKEELNHSIAETESLHTQLNERHQKEITQALIVEKLFKEKWTTLDMMCNQYFCLTNSEISEKNMISNIEKEVKRIVSKKGLKDIVEAVDQYFDGILTLLRNQCPFLKEDDIAFIALAYAGFSARSVCLFTGINYKPYFVKKKRLIDRIRKSDAKDKDMFISKIG